MTNKYIGPRSKLMGHLDRVAKIGTQPPVNVEIDVSNRCSLGCVWCHFAHTHTRGPHASKQSVNAGDLIDKDLLFKVLDDMRDYGVRSIVWSGGGEPTLHPYFEAFIDACKLPQGLYTNGNHIDTNRARLLKHRCDWVYVSLDEHRRDDYAQSKGVNPSRFESALAGIRELVAADGDATIGIGFLVNEGNWTKIEKMVDLGEKYGVDYVQFRPTILYDENSPGEIKGNTEWIAGAVSLIETISSSIVEVDLSRFEMLRNWKGHGYSTCWWSALQTVITPDGRMWACLNKRGFEEACIGDLNDASFSEIWDAAPIQEVNDRCRVMCRGHIANLEMEQIFSPRLHGSFI